MARRVLALVGLVAGGLALGLVCVAAGLLVVGMGHGWELPFRYAPLALLLYPVALVRLGWVRADWPWRAEAVGIWLGAVVFALVELQLRVLPPAPPSPSIDWLVLVVVGVLLLGCWPLARRLARRGLHPVVADVALLALGLGLDLGAVVEGADSSQARAASGLVVLWAVTWLGWQALVVAALVRHLRHRPLRSASGPAARCG